MLKNENIINNAGISFDQIYQQLLRFLPDIILAIAIILVGILLAHILRILVHRLFKNIFLLISEKRQQRGLEQIQSGQTVELIGKLLYWVIVFFFMMAASQIIGLPILTAWLNGFMLYMPRILAAAIIVFLGTVGGRLLRDLIAGASAPAGIQYGTVLGKIAQNIVFVIAVLVAVDQLGIDITVLSHVIDIFLAALLFGAALAFGLGARTSVSNILASYYVQRQYRTGQFIKIGEIEGEILQITPTAVIIASTDGHISIPAKKFNEESSIALKK
jgi:small-conductance mechanosensitive channel